MAKENEQETPKQYPELGEALEELKKQTDDKDGISPPEQKR